MYLAIGPHVGDFESEICIFLPFVKWVSSILDYKKLIVSSHFNRIFLYDFADNFFPVDPILSINELNQKNIIYKTIDKIEYNFYIKNFQESIKNFYDISKKEINLYSLNYVKNKQACSIYQLKFDKLPFEKKEEKIVFIPDKREKKERCIKIYEYLKNKYGENLIVIGDIKTYLNDENFLFLNQLNYNKIYEEIINYISNAKILICPISHWTFIANLQKVPVFSWGKFVQSFKKEGNYNNNNYKSKILAIDKYTKTERIIEQINWTMEDLKC